MNLFLDSNVWLSFYHYSKDDLEQLRKVHALLVQGKLKLFLPWQVRDEVQRNREAKISEAVARFKVEKLSSDFPRICQDYEEYAVMRSAIKTFQEAKEKLLEKLTADAVGQSLKPDELIASLFSVAHSISVTDEFLAKARVRFDRGNPPGKSGSYGDAINWEILLAEVPQGEDLYFVTNDGDYISKIRDDEFSAFLLAEWKEIKGSEIRFFSNLSALFKENFPEIKLASDVEREAAVLDLEDSSSFASTKRALRHLVQTPGLTDADISRIVNATLSNNQIFWIVGDSDVNSCLMQLTNGREDSIDSFQLGRFRHLLRGKRSVGEEFGEP